MQPPRYEHPWVGAATWAGATTTATVIALRTPPDVLTWARQGGGATAVQRDTIAMVGPALVGIGGLILLMAFAERSVVARRGPTIALPATFRALRTDAGVIVLGACALMLLHVVRAITTDGTIAVENLVIAVRVLAVGLAVGGALFAAGVLRGFTHEDLLFMPQLVAAAGLVGAGILGLALSATDNLAATVITSAMAALGGAFTSLVLSVRNLARHERAHRPCAPK